MKSCLGLGAVLVLALGSIACENPSGPTSPSTTSPFAAQFGGLYTGAMTLTAVNGGECAGTDLAGTLGSTDEGTIAITQNQSDVSAVVRSATTGLQCSYTGNASFATFAVNARSCDAEQILFACSNGQSRVLELVGSTITATVAGKTATGTVATSYNVYANSTVESIRTPIAGLVTQQTFTAVRQ
jgi:hypothetical protein